MSRKLAIISIIFFALSVLINSFKQELFGLVDGYISHEFKMNTYLLPLSLISSLAAIWVYYLEFKKKQEKKDILNLIISLPGLLISTLFAFGMIVLLLL